MDPFTVEQARRGDRAAVERLLRELQDPWYRMCLTLLGGRDTDSARDATQETGLRFLRQLSQFRGNSSVLTWSTGIAINVVREMRRKRRPEQLADGFGGGEPAGPARAAVSDDAQAPDRRASDREDAASLRALLDELPERQREAIVLRFYENFSVEETAAAMQCAPGTVKATVHQAIRSLKRKMAAESAT